MFACSQHGPSFAFEPTNPFASEAHPSNLDLHRRAGPDAATGGGYGGYGATDTRSRLCSSSRSGRKTDCIITSYDLHPPVTALDVTVSCSLLPSHVRAAASDAAAIFRARAAEKDAKHLPGCVDLGRAFLAVVFTTLGGVGPAPAREWLDGLFAASYAAELLDGGTGSRTAHRRLCLVTAMQASLVRSTTDMILHLTSPPPPPPPPPTRPP